MKKLLPLITHPLTLSLFITLLLVWLLLPSFPKYELKIIDQFANHANMIDIYDDLDGNGYSDRIYFREYSEKRSAITVLFNPRKDQQEWGVKGWFVFSTNNYFFTGDFDHSGQKEIYVFTVLNDSLFIHCISRLFDKPAVCFTRFISVVGQGNTNSQLQLTMVMGGMEDLNGDGFMELIFGVNFGASTLPRLVYSYDIHNDSLASSPKSGYRISNLTLADISGDHIKEIIVNGYASQNYQDTVSFPVHDKHCFLIVLDNRLQFLFPPVDLKLMGYSTLTTLAVPSHLGKTSLFSLYCPPLESGKDHLLYHFDQQGKILRKKEISGITGGDFLNPVLLYDHCIPFLAVWNNWGELFIFDTNFQFRKKTVIPNLRESIVTRQDIDGDQEDEQLVLDYQSNRFAVFRQDMNDPAMIDITLDSEITPITSMKKEPGKPDLFAIDAGVNMYFIQYHQSPLFYLRWLLYAGLFIGLYLLILLLSRLQRIRIENRLKTEKKITELQLKIVRNQMDPHFTMNAINAVVDAINREEKEQARENLLHFSQMYRSLVLSADKIKRTLQEELDFTENYLALERFRFGNRFTYHLRIHPEVDTRWEVPKMVIQSPVENAVKHGLLNKETGGEINIQARVEDHKLILEITDNGVGRAASAVAWKTSTGKGMEMMEQFFALYHKITGIKVQSNVSDLTDESGNPIGTRVVVMISLP